MRGEVAFAWLLAVSACTRPVPPTPDALAPDRALLRLAAHVALAPDARARRLALDLPGGLDALAVDRPAPTVYVIDPARVASGIEAAALVWRTLAAHDPSPSPARLVRMLAPCVHPGLPAFDGTAWREPLGVGSTTSLPIGPPPAFVARPAGGHVLVFAYVIPPGVPGGGMHYANLRLTDSGLVLDEAPHPERR